MAHAPRSRYASTKGGVRRERPPRPLRLVAAGLAPVRPRRERRVARGRGLVDERQEAAVVVRGEHADVGGVEEVAGVAVDPLVPRPGQRHDRVLDEARRVVAEGPPHDRAQDPVGHRRRRRERRHGHAPRPARRELREARRDAGVAPVVHGRARLVDLRERRPGRRPGLVELVRAGNAHDVLQHADALPLERRRAPRHRRFAGSLAVALVVAQAPRERRRARRRGRQRRGERRAQLDDHAWLARARCSVALKETSTTINAVSFAG